MKMTVIGIDLGTTYSAVAAFIDGETEIVDLEGASILPSIVSIHPRSGKVIIGKSAKNNQINNPQDTIVEIKRKMGESKRVAFGQETYLPQEISAMILRRLKELAENHFGEEITGVVISCPAYFKDEARHATKEAGELAGLNVLRIVNEPTAAAYAYGLMQGKDTDKERLMMVYDLGGGTFDVTVIKILAGNVEVIGTGGDPQLGGGNFDDRIVEWMFEKLEKTHADYMASLNEPQKQALKIRLKLYAEDGKKQLCGPPPREAHQFQIPSIATFEGRPVPFNEILTMDEFNKQIEERMLKSLECLDEAMKVPKEKHNYTENHLTDILLVGGSTRVPYIRQLLQERYPNVPLRGVESGINPDEIVARGASIVAAQLDPDSDEFIDTELTDVTGHTLSVAVFDPQQNREILHPLIPKETPIPTKSKHQFATSGNMTPMAKVRIYQGEATDPNGKDTPMIGEFIIEVERRQEPTPLEIGLNLDANGLLIAHATDLITQRQVKCEINYDDNAQMSKEELARRRAELAQQIGRKMSRAANPLEAKAQSTAESATGWAKPERPSQPLDTKATTTPPIASDDPLAVMNPIVHSLHQKAITNFMHIPADQQQQVMQLVSGISQAVEAGDQTTVMRLGMELQPFLANIP
jgi:molecular chaperone DnaK